MDDDTMMPASAAGILQCLLLLAREAASLNMMRALSAIEDAVEATTCECSLDSGEMGFRGRARQLMH